MADVKKPNWPQTPDGTIDWETVFEDPETGLIPVLSQANNKEILHKVTVTVIKQLFTRKNDEIEVQRFLKELDVILGETAGSEDLPKMQDAILNLMRRIKSGRVEKAAAYVAEKKKKAALGAKDGRKKERELKTRRQGEDEKKKTATMITIGGVALLVIAATIVLLFLFVWNDEDSPDSGRPPEEVAKIAAAEKAAERAAEKATEKQPQETSDAGYPIGRMGPEEVADLAPNVMVMRQFVWAGQVEGGSPRGTPLIPVLIIDEEKYAKRICDYAPNLIDAINLALGRSAPAGEKLDVDTLRKAGRVALEMVNKRLGNSWIRDLYLLYDVDRKLIATAQRCRLVKP